MNENRLKSNGSFLLISDQDFRSKRKSNVHFIADELSTRGHTKFFSVGFSALSKIKKDPRLSLIDRANVVENINGVETYLWRSFLHPFNLNKNVFAPLEGVMFKSYAESAPHILLQWIRHADCVVIESGLGVIFFDLIKRENEKAKIIYMATDSLSTIGCARYIIRELERIAPRFTSICVPSTALVSEFSRELPLSFIPHGIDHANRDITTESPYTAPVNVVSVGSMLFDRSFFEIACDALPEVMFHIIGAGPKAVGLKARNLISYDEMPFNETIAYIKHADAGIAPYQGDKVAPYLVDTSLKLMQYGFFGIPAICPNMVVGNHQGRFGYEPENKTSIASAIRTAIAYGHFPGTRCLTWAEVTDRLLDPMSYADTWIPAAEQFHD